MDKIREQGGNYLHCPEFQFVLACARPSQPLDSHDQSASGLLLKVTDWDYLLRLADWHGLLPFVARHLIGNSSVPDNVVEEFKRSSPETLIRNLRLTDELIQISTALEMRGIEHTPYKGTVLSQLLYGTIAQRSISDIDLVVRAEDVGRAVTALEELGFVDGFQLSSAQRTNAINHGCEYTFIRNGVTVDLHWRLVKRYAWPSLDMELVWRQLVPFKFCGRSLKIFSTEIMLAALCVHSAEHEWMQLKMFADIAKLISEHPDLDWELVEAAVGDSHSRRSLLVALSLTKDYLGIGLPPQIARDIERDPQVGNVARRVYSEVWPSPEVPLPTHADIQWMLFRSKGEEMGDRVRYLLSVAFGPTIGDFQSVSFPESLGWFYYFLRPLRIMHRRLVG